MFEKEAEEYANRYVSEGVDELKIKVIKGHWQDGAEFGYNKALEEQCDKIESAYREGVAFGKGKLIEKMKCCGNCGKWENCEKDEMFSQDICGDWELER